MTVRGNGRKEIFHDEDYYLRFLDQLTLVSGDEYISRLTRYIHLNPIKIERNRRVGKDRKIAQLDRYKWSSYRGYIDEEHSEEIVNYSWLDLMGRKTDKGKRQAYRKYVESCIVQKDAFLEASLEQSRYAIGDEDFIEKVNEDLEDSRLSKGVYGDVKWPERESISPEEIASIVSEAYALDRTLLSGRSSAAQDAKKVAVELACRHSNLSQRKVGETFGYTGNGSVVKQRARLRELLASNETLKRKFLRIERKIINS